MPINELESFAINFHQMSSKRMKSSGRHPEKDAETERKGRVPSSRSSLIMGTATVAGMSFWKNEDNNNSGIHLKISKADQNVS